LTDDAHRPVGNRNLGRHAAREVHRHPDLELVGAYVYSADKTGRDVGEICGIRPIGVTATGDLTRS
jgi:2,4-diaminopentanoate dehydrogenase